MNVDVYSSQDTETDQILDGGLVCPQGKTTGQEFLPQWTHEDIALWTLYDASLGMTQRQIIEWGWQIDGDIVDRLLEEYSEWLKIKKLEISKKRVHAGHELGPRAFTLTYSPKWGFTDLKARELLELAVDRLLTYYKNEIIEFHVAGEVGKNGLSHIHGYYELFGGRKITDKNFKRAWQYWDPKTKVGDGFKGGYHRVCERKSDYLAYLAEDKLWLKKSIVNKQNAPSEEKDCPQAENDPA